MGGQVARAIWWVLKATLLKKMKSQAPPISDPFLIPSIYGKSDPVDGCPSLLEAVFSIDYFHIEHTNCIVANFEFPDREGKFLLTLVVLRIYK